MNKVISTGIREKIIELIKAIPSLDSVESQHKAEIIKWISSNEEIFRIRKPDVPPRHLVSYTVLVDIAVEKVLLLYHTKALKFLPSGGHLQKNEHPHSAAVRELYEELQIESPKFILTENPLLPFFVTETETVGLTAGHSDVSLWYVVRADSTLPLRTESQDFANEFSEFKWLPFDEVLAMDIRQLDPHMHRFVKKVMKVAVV